MSAATTTAPSGTRLVQSVEDLALEVKMIRYCPLAELDQRCLDLALRIANAEAIAWDATRGPK